MIILCFNHFMNMNKITTEKKKNDVVFDITNTRFRSSLEIYHELYNSHLIS